MCQARFPKGFGVLRSICRTAPPLVTYLPVNGAKYRNTGTYVKT